MIYNAARIHNTEEEELDRRPEEPAATANQQHDMDEDTREFFGIEASLREETEQTMMTVNDPMALRQLA